MSTPPSHRITGISPPGHGRKRLALGLLLFAGLVLPLTGRAQATLYWDINGTTAGAGGATPAGTWRTSGSGNQNWNTSAAGTGTTDFWTNDSIAVFSAGTDASGSYTVTVSSAPTVDSIIIQEGNLTFNSNSLTLTGSTPSITVAAGLVATFNTRISGTDFVKAGDGTVVFTGTSKNYSGDTLINAGTLQLGANNMIVNTSAVVVASGATLDVAGYTETVGSLAGAGSVNLGTGTLTAGGNNADTAFTGTLSGSGTLGKAGSGTLTLSGNNTGFSGTFDVNNTGALLATTADALGSGNVDLASGTALQIQGGIALAGGTVTTRGSGQSDTGAIRNLSGDNSLAAAITVASTTTIAADAGRLSLSGDIALTTRTLTVGGAGNILLSGAVTGTSGKIVKEGAGTLTLSGITANTFAGALTLNNGVIELNKTAGINATGGGAVVVGDGTGAAASATLRLLADNQLPDNSGVVTINADGKLDLNNHAETIDRLAGSGDLDFGSTGALTIGANDGASTFGGTFTGNGTLTKTGTSLLTLTSDLDFAGTFNLAAGTLRLSGIDLTVGTLNITGNSTIDFAGATASLFATTLTIGAGVTLNITNWSNATDYFFATNWSGATFNTTGSNPMNQVTFNGFSANDTKWLEYDHQITPVPEPSAYGVLLLGSLTGWFIRRRFRRRG